MLSSQEELAEVKVKYLEVQEALVAADSERQARDHLLHTKAEIQNVNHKILNSIGAQVWTFSNMLDCETVCIKCV